MSKNEMESMKQIALINHSVDQINSRFPSMAFLGVFNYEVLESSPDHIQFTASYSSNMTGNLHDFKVTAKCSGSNWNYEFKEQK
jgi:hypothetical protein